MKKLTTSLMLIVLFSMALGFNCFAAEATISTSSYPLKDFTDLSTGMESEMIRNLVDGNFQTCLYSYIAKDSFTMELIPVEEDYVMGNEVLPEDWFFENEASGIQITGFIEVKDQDAVVEAFEKEAPTTFVQCIMPLSSCTKTQDSIQEYIKEEQIPISWEVLSVNDQWAMLKLNFNIYKVSEGDTLSGIAKEFDLPLSQLIELNGIKDPNQIAVGEILILQ